MEMVTAVDEAGYWGAATVVGIREEAVTRAAVAVAATADTRSTLHTRSCRNMNSQRCTTSSKAGRWQSSPRAVDQAAGRVGRMVATVVKAAEEGSGAEAGSVAEEAAVVRGCVMAIRAAVGSRAPERAAAVMRVVVDLWAQERAAVAKVEDATVVGTAEAAMVEAAWAVGAAAMGAEEEAAVETAGRMRMGGKRCCKCTK